MLTPALIAHPRKLGPSIPQVTIDALSVRQVECDSPKHLFQVESGEGIDNAFGRFASQKGIHHGVKRNSAPGYVIPAFALFDVFLRHADLYTV
jgi:hypothetical protein